MFTISGSPRLRAVLQNLPLCPFSSERLFVFSEPYAMMDQVGPSVACEARVVWEARKLVLLCRHAPNCQVMRTLVGFWPQYGIGALIGVHRPGDAHKVQNGRLAA